MSRQEQDVFDELGVLCSSSGYAHAIAYFCFRDNVVKFRKELTPKDLGGLYSEARLIRTEISTLIGLMARQAIDYALPPQEVVKKYVEKTQLLLDELHTAMTASWLKDLDPAKLRASNPFANGEALREPIFYSGESAFSFQYRELARRKFAKDNSWLQSHKGFSIDSAADVVRAVGRYQDEKQVPLLRSLAAAAPEKWTFLPGFTFSTHEIADFSGIDFNLVEAVFSAFSLSESERNASFNALNEFNITNSTPLLRRGRYNYTLFQYYGLTEALYETPFYWMATDRTYSPKALSHRGEFTEAFTAERLRGVFGEGNVYTNVDLIRKNGEKLGEIDVLVLYGGRAVLVQAKSKRLTIEARKGNDLQIKDDFKKAIQDSYDQAYKCSLALNDPGYDLRDAAGNKVRIAHPLQEIFPLCIVADHYPALAFQARQFLSFKVSEKIRAPIVTDVFAVDAITEMLKTPLRIISYLSLRAQFGDRLIAMHEMTLLSYHLKRNLWVDTRHDLVMLGDDIATDLDVAMIVRREGLPGPRTPDGILTRLQRTAVGRYVAEIEANPDPATVDLGLLLLELGEDTVKTISHAIKIITAAARKDYKTHDVTVGLGKASCGLTIHCSSEPDVLAVSKLSTHCEGRKYSERASRWFGIVIRPEDGSIRFGIEIEHPWKFEERLDKTMASLDTKRVLQKQRIAIKVGRNEPCPCGSGKKYKKCCLA